MKHGHRIGHFGVEFPYPAVVDGSRGVNRFAEFLVRQRPKWSNISKGDRRLVFGGTQQYVSSVIHFLAEGECLVIGELNHGDRQVGDNAAKEFSSYPEGRVELRRCRTVLATSQAG